MGTWWALEEEHYHSYLAGTLDFQGQRRARARDFAAAHGVWLTDAAAWFDTAPFPSAPFPSALAANPTRPHNSCKSHR